MARSANSQNIKKEQDGPDFQSVISLVRGKLRDNDAEQSSLAQDNSTIFKRIEQQHGVHRGAAKDFGKIDRMSPEKRTDYLRSLLGLLGFAGYDNFGDLVDMAQAPVATPAEKKTKTKTKAPDALDGTQPPAGERVDLARGWIVRPDLEDPTKFEDVREATAEEMALARESQADFDVPAAGNVHKFPGAASN